MSAFVLVNFVTLFWCHLIAFIVLCGYKEFDVSKRLQDSHYPQNGHYQWDSHQPRRVTILRMVTAPMLKTNAKMNTISYLSLTFLRILVHSHQYGYPSLSPRWSATITKTVTHPSIQPPLSLNQSPTILRKVIQHQRESHKTSKGQSLTFSGMVIQLTQYGHSPEPPF